MITKGTSKINKIKIINILLAAVLIINVIYNPVLVTRANDNIQQDTIEINISIVNNVSNNIVVPLTTLTFLKSTTLYEILDKLKSDKFILGYTVSGDTLNSIKDKDNLEIKSDSLQSLEWKCTINQKSQIDYMNTPILSTSKIELEYYKLNNNSLSSNESIDFNSSSESSLISSNESSSNVEILSSYTSSSNIWNSSSDSKAFDSTSYSKYWTQMLDNVLENSLIWLENKNHFDLKSIAMSIAGKQLDHKSISILTNRINDNRGDYSDVRQLELDIMALSFAGFNPLNTNNINLVKQLYDHEKEFNLEEAIFAITTYDINQYTIPVSAKQSREKLIEKIILAQNADGGFSNETNMDSNLILTSSAIIALSNYKSNDQIKKYISSAIEFLSKYVSTVPSISNFNSSILSHIITAMMSVDIPLTDERFLFLNQTLIDVLLYFYKDEKGFSIDYSGSIDDYSTAISIIALISVKYNSNPFILKNNVILTDYTNSNANLVSYILTIIVISAMIVLYICAFIINKKRSLCKDTLKKPNKSQDNVEFDNLD